MPSSIRLATRALTAFDQPAPDEQAAVTAAVKRLEHQGVVAQGGAFARLPDEADLYLTASRACGACDPPPGPKRAGRGARDRPPDLPVPFPPGRGAGRAVSPFASIDLDHRRCTDEPADLRRLLDPSGRSLRERAEILDFFGARPQLTAILGASATGVVAIDRVAYELDLFGLFRADAEIGDSAKRAYCLIEFEDAARDSIFARGTRCTGEWSPRFDQGFDQIVD